MYHIYPPQALIDHLSRRSSDETQESSQKQPLGDENEEKRARERLASEVPTGVVSNAAARRGSDDGTDPAQAAPEQRTSGQERHFERSRRRPSSRQARQEQERSPTRRVARPRPDLLLLRLEKELQRLGRGRRRTYGWRGAAVVEGPSTSEHEAGARRRLPRRPRLHSQRHKQPDRLRRHLLPG